MPLISYNFKSNSLTSGTHGSAVCRVMLKVVLWHLLGLWMCFISKWSPLVYRGLFNKERLGSRKKRDVTVSNPHRRCCVFAGESRRQSYLCWSLDPRSQLLRVPAFQNANCPRSPCPLNPGLPPTPTPFSYLMKTVPLTYHAVLKISTGKKK